MGRTVWVGYRGHHQQRWDGMRSLDIKCRTVGKERRLWLNTLIQVD